MVTATIPAPVIRIRPRTAGSTPAEYADATELQERLRALARSSGAYARLLADRPGIRLAYFVRTGAVGALTDHGRALLRSDLDLVTRAATIPAGLDTNAFYDRLLSRPARSTTPPTRSGARR